MSGGVGRDRIVALDAAGGVEIKGPGGRARFAPVSEVLYDNALPGAFVTVRGHTRGYPLSILASHEVVTDVIEGLPVLATYCPLCNTALAFERTVAGQLLDFGVSGHLRHADLIMFDYLDRRWRARFRRPFEVELASTNKELVRVRRARSGPEYTEVTT